MPVLRGAIHNKANRTVTRKFGYVNFRYANLLNAYMNSVWYQSKKIGSFYISNDVKKTINGFALNT